MRLTLSTLNLMNVKETLPERLSVLERELEFISPSIFAVQELLHDPERPGELVPSISTVIAEAGLKLTTLPASSQVGDTFHSVGLIHRPDHVTVLETGQLTPPPGQNMRFPAPNISYAVYQPVEPDTKTVIVFTAHLAWGAPGAPVRLATAKLVEGKAAVLAENFPDALVFLAGDFNDLPESDTVRYLRGLTAQEPATSWIDVWPWLNPSLVGYTQHPTSKYAVLTAASVGIDRPEMMPSRRIDYIMVRGWSYAQIGSNPTLDLWGTNNGEDVSDHLGLVLDFDA